MSETVWWHRKSAIVACVAGFGLLALAVIVIDATFLEPGQSLTREGGGIETMSVIGYLVVLGICFWIRRGQILWPVPVLLLALPAREIDADKIFTQEGILSLDILFHDTPLYEKALAVTVWIVLTGAIVSLLRHRGRAFLADLRRRKAWVGALTTGLVLIVVSKSIDGLDRKLHAIGIHPSNALARGSGTLEEVLELLIPPAFMVTILLQGATGSSEDECGLTDRVEPRQNA